MHNKQNIAHFTEKIKKYLIMNRQDDDVQAQSLYKPGNREF